MVNVKTELSLRGKRRRERLERIKKAKPEHSGVRVVPTDEKYRVLKHPNGVGFRPEGGIEWPNDRFTKRRIAEGAVKLENDREKPPPHHRSSRHDDSSAA